MEPFDWKIIWAYIESLEERIKFLEEITRNSHPE
jgi:hypothetical protein